MDIEIGGETFHKEPNLLEQIAYRDTWGRGADSFIAMIYERLILMRDLLAAEGSIYVHCDWRVTSSMSVWLSMKCLGVRNFLNEIIWKRNAHSDMDKDPSIWDEYTTLILLYSKSKRIRGIRSFSRIRRGIHRSSLQIHRPETADVID